MVFLLKKECVIQFTNMILSVCLKHSLTPVPAGIYIHSTRWLQFDQECKKD